jgi:YesN/AraC family two-component response regulator
MEGFIVYEAEDGEATFEIFEKKTSDTDIIIVYIQIPKLNKEQMVKKSYHLIERRRS